MKKIKKLKIIEEGRYSKEELKQIRGGCNNFTGCNKYSNCGWFSHTSCQKVGAYGYENDPGSGTTTCDSGFSYSSCEFKVYTSCGPNTTYKS